MRTGKPRRARRPPSGGAVNSGADEPSHRAPFEVAVHWGEDGSVRLVPVGELDVSTAPQLHTRLEEVIAKARGEVHLDMAGLRFCAAAGITELLRARRSLAALGRRLVLTAVPEQIARAIRLAEGDALLDD
jgi:anti-anti-sigma factor